MSCQHSGVFRLSKKYKVWDFDIVGNATFVCIDVGAFLRAEYGASYDVPAKTVMIVADDNYQLKINGLTNDTIPVNITDMGKVFTLDAGDLEILKLCFASQVPSGSAPDTHITLIVTG